ncbi:SIR2 family protein [Gordonia alkanivorans]|nr:SIR2 family protein [Gordonia alkanivorans]MDJ0010399.1 SIR2 family protein [Gordonia alkanivorans]
MSGGHNLAMLVGNGLSVAFSDQLELGSISAEMIRRFTSEYPGSDAVAQAMHKVADHQLTGDPAKDFEILIGAFGGQSDILEDLATFANLTKGGDPDIVNSIQRVRDFASEVQRRGVGHTLEIITERSYSDTYRRGPVNALFDNVLGAFTNHVTVANLNYDLIVLSALMDHKRILSDMAHGKYDGGTIAFAGEKHRTWRIRESVAEFMPLSSRRLRLLHLHGSLTFWRFGEDHRKIQVDAVRLSSLWQTYRDEDTFNGHPLIVLANQNDKAKHIQRFPFNLAYDIADTDLKDADHWLIVGYSFRDECVNDLLSQAWEARRGLPTTILVSTYGNDLTTDTIEDALGWSRGSADTNNLTVNRDGAFDLCSSPEWTAFIRPVNR